MNILTASQMQSGFNQILPGYSFLLYTMAGKVISERHDLPYNSYFAPTISNSTVDVMILDVE